MWGRVEEDSSAREDGGGGYGGVGRGVGEGGEDEEYGEDKEGRGKGEALLGDCIRELYTKCEDYSFNEYIPCGVEK